MWPSRHSSRPYRLPIFALRAVLAIALSVSLVSCDSSGTNSENDTGNNGGGDVTQTFQVTVESIDGTDYQYADQNNVGVAYAIDGTVGKEITLERGKTYAFELASSVENGPNNATHPFYIGETAEGQGGDEFSNGVENEKATSGTVTFTVPSGAPSALYYQCDAHAYMGGDISITDNDGGGDNPDDDY